MRKSVLVTAVALVGASGSAQAQVRSTIPAATVKPYSLQGSDTLRELSRQVVTDSGTAADVNYVGGGSSAGGVALGAGTQQVSPQSRFLNATECGNVATYNNNNGLAGQKGEGVQIALDGVAVLHDDTEGAATNCRTIRYAGCMPVEDLNVAATLGYGNGTVGLDDGTGASIAGLLNASNEYCFTDWRDVLRIIYTGQTAHVSTSDLTAGCNPNAPTATAIGAKRCNSDIRRTLVQSWGNMFDEANKEGDGACTDGHCTSLRHAYRRDDFSGTTDVFLGLIGAPTLGSGFNVRTFCNGLENEDLDVIRRPCTSVSNSTNDPDTVCAPIPFRNRNVPFGADGSPNAQAGNTAPTPPAANSTGDLGLVLPVSLPTQTALQYDNNFCSGTSPLGGSFKYAPVPPALSTNAQRCPDGNGRTGGQCRYPVYSSGPNIGRFNCKARRTNRPGSIAWPNFDARAYNLIPRDPVTGAILQPNSNSILDPRWGGGGHYRIAMAFAQPSQTATPFTAGAHPTCTQPDATQQLGCLVQADPCSIAFAGLESIDRDANADDLAVSGVNLPFLVRSEFDSNTAETGAGDDREIDALVTSNIEDVLDPAGTACSAPGTCDVDATCPGFRPGRCVGDPTPGDGTPAGTCDTDYEDRYPLARILWLNGRSLGGQAAVTAGTLTGVTNTVLASDGVTVLTTNENTFAVEYISRTPAANARIASFGFIPLPTAYPNANRFRSCP